MLFPIAHGHAQYPSCVLCNWGHLPEALGRFHGHKRKSKLQSIYGLPAGGGGKQMLSYTPSIPFQVAYVARRNASKKCCHTYSVLVVLNLHRFETSICSLMFCFLLMKLPWIRDPGSICSLMFFYLLMKLPWIRDPGSICSLVFFHLLMKVPWIRDPGSICSLMFFSLSSFC